MHSVAAARYLADCVQMPSQYALRGLGAGGSAIGAARYVRCEDTVAAQLESYAQGLTTAPNGSDIPVVSVEINDPFERL